jgi:hypothetical protein
MNTLADSIAQFMCAVASGHVEIYNEFSLQHELGIFLRSRWPEYRTQFERNVSYFGATKKAFTKRELDIAIFSPDLKTLRYAIELKFPRSGQHPEQMFSFCKDIAFAEELNAAGFNQTAFVAVADDRLFYQGGSDGIYAYFRGQKPLTGTICKPTGAKDDSVTIKGSYTIRWLPITGNMHYTLVLIGNDDAAKQSLDQTSDGEPSSAGQLQR